jgi:ubiquinone/menaquinone biosynthesis C-methylase UbiE
MHFRWAARLYDPFLNAVGWEKLFRRRFNAMIGLQPGFRVLDVGCGTGSQLVLMKAEYPVVATGLDYDDAILAVARRKIEKTHLDIALVRGTGAALPFADGLFDRVISSLVFHHLSTADKRAAMREVLRVLASGGEFYLADFGAPTSRAMRLAGWFLSLLERTEDNLKGLLPLMMTEAGFQNVGIHAGYSTILGSMAVYQGKKAVG